MTCIARIAGGRRVSGSGVHVVEELSGITRAPRRAGLGSDFFRAAFRAL